MSSYINELVAPRTMTDAEVAKLLATTGEHRDGFRDHCIFSLALGTALREHEILALDVGAVFSAEGTPKRRVRLTTFKRSNDDPAMQEVFLPDALRGKLAKLWKCKKADGHRMADDAPLFVSRQGNRLGASTLRWLFATWQERAGFERRFNFHQLRHTACTNVYRASGNDIRVVQRVARHRSIRSTQIYTHPSDQDVLRAVCAVPC
jgi:site-specific recombinase XerC